VTLSPVIYFQSQSSATIMSCVLTVLSVRTGEFLFRQHFHSADNVAWLLE